MPYSPHTTQGTLPNYDLKEFGDTGLMITGCDITPRAEFKEKPGHAAGATGPNGAYGRILQVQTKVVALDGELKGEIVPDANGKAVGLANAYPGQTMTCAQFAAGDDYDVHGFTRDATKLMLVKEIKRSLTSDKVPEVTIPWTYYPDILAA